MSCGCEILYERDDGDIDMAIGIFYCPMHEAAPEMWEVIEIHRNMLNQVQSLLKIIVGPEYGYLPESEERLTKLLKEIDEKYEERKNVSTTRG